MPEISESLRFRKRGAIFPILLLLLYLLVEYGRPAILQGLRPALVVQVLLIVYLLANAQGLKAVVQNRFFQIFLILLLLMSVHVFVATNNYWAFMQLRLMFSYFLIALAFCRILDNPPKVQLILDGFLVIHFLGALNRLIPGNLLGMGVSGVMGDTNDFALAMNVAIPISFFMGRESSGIRQKLYFGATGFFVIANAFCMSRGGFVGLLAVGLICLSVVKRKSKAIFAFILLAVVFWQVAPPEFREEISQLEESVGQGTGKDRLELWKVGIRAFMDNPILGVGQGNMPVLMGEYQYDERGESYWGRQLYGRAIHSVYFTLAPELGLVGISIMILLLRDAWRKVRAIAREAKEEGNPGGTGDMVRGMRNGLSAGLAGYLVTGTFISVLYYPQLWNLLALVTALSMAAPKLRRTRLVQERALAQWKEEKCATAG